VGITDKMWDGITRVIKMDAKVEDLSTVIKNQQIKIEDLTGRIIRLETALEIAMISKIQIPLDKK
jgi:hypothetical protein